ncbi:MAG TPA: hypothetical protein VHE80_07875 [Acidimicrobiales bacterium]|nr:hypothetical protein [Acidimicrobiales bacterium]
MGVKRAAAVLVGAAVAVVVVTGVAAFACTNLATLNLSGPSAGPGESITATGSSFAVAEAGAPQSPVQLRWNGVDGEVLAEVTPDTAGSISATFTVPQAEPGQYVIVATQRDAEGEDEFGTPARAVFEVLGPGGQPARPVAEAPVSGGAESSSAGAIALMAGLGIVGVSLFALGSRMFVRELRSRQVPAVERLRRD